MLEMDLMMLDLERMGLNVGTSIFLGFSAVSPHDVIFRISIAVVSMPQAQRNRTHCAIFDPPIVPYILMEIHSILFINPGFNMLSPLNLPQGRPDRLRLCTLLFLPWG